MKNPHKKQPSLVFITNVNATSSHHAVNVPSDVVYVTMISCPIHRRCRTAAPTLPNTTTPIVAPILSAKYPWIDTPYLKSSARHVIPSNRARPMSAFIVRFHLRNIIAQYATFGCPIHNLLSIVRNVECVVWGEVRIISIVICVECVCRLRCMRVIIVSLWPLV